MKFFKILSILALLHPYMLGCFADFFVNNPIDGLSLMDECISGESCNLRSAWSACQNQTTQMPCLIRLEDDSVNNINSTLGPLKMIPTDRIAIYGESSSIVFGEESSFIIYDSDANITSVYNTFPTLNMSSVTIFGFGGGQNLGGAIKFSGEGSAHFHNVTFSQNLALVGGALYFQDSTLGVTIEGCVFHANKASDGGAIALVQNNRNIVIAHSIISGGEASNIGGGIYIGESNEAITIESVLFDNCKAVFGGGMAQIIGNRMINVVDSLFTNCTANHYGGGLFLYQQNEEIALRNTRFVRCSAVDGGAVLVDEENHAFTVRNTVFVECAATTNNGGGLHARSKNNQIQLINTTFERCSAHYDGGGLFLGSENMQASILQTAFVNCTAGSTGGGLVADFQNLHLTLYEVNVVRCSALFGGGLSLEQGNANCTIAQSRFVDCNGTYRGGAINAGSENNHLFIVNTSIINGQSEYGGGLLSSRNKDMSIQYSMFQNCSAKNDGGGIFLYAENRRVVLLETNFESNVAQYGGGIASYPPTRGLVIAGCSFWKNEAINDGGGILLTGGNEQFIITDAYSGFQAQVVESEHPYENVAADGIIFARTVREPEAETFVLHFDADSALNSNDEVSIFDSNGNEVFSVFYDGYWPGRQLEPLRVAGQEFTIVMRGYASSKPPTSKADGLFGFKLYVSPVMKNPTRPTWFAHNKAGNKGGALHMAFYTSFASIVNTVFLYNRAVDGGGAVSLRSAATGITIENSWFAENESEWDGGAMYVESSAGGIFVRNCSFTLNRAEMSGGAVTLLVSNGRTGLVLASGTEVYFLDCIFSNNTAYEGGAMYLDRDNEATLRDCALINNEAQESGGGIHLESENLLRLVSTTLDGNWAGLFGGGLAAGVNNELFMQSVSIVGSEAGWYGGGMYFSDEVDVSLSGHFIFARNTAGFIGGALASFKSQVWYIDPEASVSIHHNTAERGSALYYRAVPEGSTQDLRNTFLANNSATIGGTVYWLKDEQMSVEPLGLFDGGVTWANNAAPYGPKVATQAVRVHGPESYDVLSYGESLNPPLQFTLQDAYGQVIPRDGITHFVAALANASSQQCTGRIPTLAGRFEEAYNLTASFAKLQVVCSPAGEVPITFKAQLDLLETEDKTDNAKADYSIQTTIALKFRSCRRGEIIREGKCIVCPRSTYSLEYPVTAATTCTDCAEKGGVLGCGGDVIKVGSGYWRRLNDSEAVLDCLGDTNGCRGGTGTGDSLCDEGYSGPLCAVCTDGYYSSDGVCESCGGSATFSPTVVVFLAFAGVILGLLVFLFYVKCIDGGGNENGDDDRGSVVSEYPDYWPTCCKRSWIREKFHKMQTQVKIVITTYQIVSSIPENMSVTLPPAFTSMLNAFSVFNLNVISVVPFSCSSHYTFVDTLVFTTLFPIGLSIILFLVGVVDAAWQMRKLRLTDPARKSVLSVAKDQYLTYFFFLTYLVLPSVATTIFQTFLCTNVDPRGEDNEVYDRFLIADMSISCTSDYYYRAVAYAIAMALVYVVGIPLMYFLMLYYNREELMHRDDEVVDSSANEESADQNPDSANTLTAVTSSAAAPCEEQAVSPLQMSVEAQRLSFLWEAYEPQFWYWEVVETTRRLVLTAVLSVCGAGTSVQSILAVLLGLLYIKLYGFYAPYVKDTDDVVAEVGQFQIFFSFLGALIYQNSLLGPEWNEVVSVVLILINAAVTALFTYYACQELREQIEDAKGLYAGEEQRSCVIPRESWPNAEEDQECGEIARHSAGDAHHLPPIEDVYRLHGVQAGGGYAAAPGAAVDEEDRDSADSGEEKMLCDSKVIINYF